MENKIEIIELNCNENLNISLLENNIPAGFPSPAQDANSDTLDLNRELIHSPSSTFCARVSGDSMIDCGISDGDLLIIDKALTPHDGSIAVCYIDGDFTVKRISIHNDGIYLMPANPNYRPIPVSEDSNFQVWGIVTYIVKSVRSEE